MKEQIGKEIQDTKLMLTRAIKRRDEECVRACQSKLIRLELRYREIKKRA